MTTLVKLQYKSCPIKQLYPCAYYDNSNYVLSISVHHYNGQYFKLP